MNQVKYSYNADQAGHVILDSMLHKFLPTDESKDIWSKFETPARLFKVSHVFYMWWKASCCRDMPRYVKVCGKNCLSKKYLPGHDKVHSKYYLASLQDYFTRLLDKANYSKPTRSGLSIEDHGSLLSRPLPQFYGWWEVKRRKPAYLRGASCDFGRFMDHMFSKLIRWEPPTKSTQKNRPELEWSQRTMLVF